MQRTRKPVGMQVRRKAMTASIGSSMVGPPDEYALAKTVWSEVT
jgi:hypothetical protein